MQGPSSSPSPAPELPEWIDELAQLAQSDLSPESFYTELLARVAAAIGAVGSSAWERAEGKLALVASTGEQPADNAPLLQAVIANAAPRLVSPGWSGSGPLKNPTKHLLGIAPVVDAERPYGVIEFRLPGDLPSSEQSAVYDALSIVGDLAVGYYRHRELSELRGNRDWWRSLDRFAQDVHANLRQNEIALTIANEGRPLLACDRLTVLLVRAGRPRAVAISGQDSINRRANVIRLMEKLVQRALKTREPLWHPQQRDLPPQVDAALQPYLDVSHVRQLAIIPLPEIRQANLLPTSPSGEPAPVQGELMAALVVERFSEEPLDQSRVIAVAEHAQRALRNVREHRSIFLLPLWSAIGKMSWIIRARTLPKTLLIAALLAAGIAALFLVPADFELAAQGSLEPLEQRFIFAPEDGVVEELRVRHGSSASPDKTLLKMRSSEIDLELEEIEGQLQTTVKRIAAINAMRSSGASGGQLSRVEVNRMAAEKQELSQWRESLEVQRDLLLARQSQLDIHSPIEGEVVTWNLEKQLAARPVKKGQVLLSVAKCDGEWVLELQMPDHQVGHLRDALAKAPRDGLPVRYILATDPGRTLHGVVHEIARRTSLHEKHGLGVAVTVNIDEQDLQQPRPGASVAARVDCGKRPIGFVWFHDVLEFVQSRIIFRMM